MAKKHKHEEHVNHERWVISFADMMTLLFALFVVLYAMGVQDLEKLKKLKKSIQFAFSISGSGKTKDEGIFEKVTGAGDIQVPAPLVTAQDGEMREFLKEVLEEFKEVSGKSLEIILTDDTVSMTAPLSDFFPPGRAYPVERDAQAMIDKAIDGSMAYTSDIRIVIETPNVLIGRDPRRREPISSVDLCIERLKTIGRLMRANPRVREEIIETSWRSNNQPLRGDWEDQAKLIIAFSNMRAENR